MSSEMEKLQKKSMLLHVSGVSVLALLTLVLCYAIVEPARQAQRDAADAANQMALQDSEYDRLTMQQRQLTSQLAGTTQEIAASGLNLLPASSLNSKLGQISEIAERSGLQIDSIDPQAAINGKSLVVFPIQISGKASYRKFHGFVQSLKTAASDTSVERFSLTASPGTNPSNGTFTMTLFWCASRESEKTAAIQP